MLQNLLFYYESENCSRPSGVVMLEGCYCDRLITAKGKEPDKQVCVLVCARKLGNIRNSLCYSLLESPV